MYFIFYYVIHKYIRTYIHKYISKTIMRLNITISIESEVLEEFDSSRGELSRGDYIAELLKCSEPFKSSTPDKKEVKPRREKLDKLVKDGVVKRGVKELPSQEVEGFKTYFKKKK